MGNDPYAQQGGSDTIPVAYVNPTLAQRLVYPPYDQQPTYYEYPTIATATWPPIVIRGNNTAAQRQAQIYGTLNIRVNAHNLSTGGPPMPGGPAFVDVIFDGVDYKIQVGQVVTVPAIIYQLINQTNVYNAVIV